MVTEQVAAVGSGSLHRIWQGVAARLWVVILVAAGLAVMTEPCRAVSPTTELAELETRVRSLILESINPRTGALMRRPLGSPANQVHPWFAHAAAMALLESGSAYYPQVKGWLSWLCTHINDGSVRSLYGRKVAAHDLRSGSWAGTFFIHRVNPDLSENKVFLAPRSLHSGGAEPAKTATDNWSASFLILADEYLARSADRRFIGNCLPKLRMASTHLERLLTGPAGRRMTRAAPDLPVRFTTDNMYSFAGLLHYSMLLRRMTGHDSEALHSSALAGEVLEGLRSLSYQKSGGHYLTAVESSSFHWERFYGDAVANVQGLTFANPELMGMAERNWGRFVAANSKWSQLVTTDMDGRQPREVDRSGGRYDWSMIALAAIRAGEPARALTFIRNAAATAHEFERNPTHSGMMINELGWFLRALLRLRGAVIIDDADGLQHRTGDVRITSVSWARRTGSVRPVLSQPVLGKSYLFGNSGSRITVPLPARRDGYYVVHLLDITNAARSPAVRVTIRCRDSADRPMRTTRGTVDQRPAKTAISRELRSCYLRSADSGAHLELAVGNASMALDGVMLIPAGPVS
jgi:hypothetical protein